MQIICQVLKKYRGVCGPMAGDKRLSQKHPGPWLLMLRVLGWGLFFSQEGGGWDGMSYVQSGTLSHTVVHTLEGSCCHGLCAELPVFLLFGFHTVALCGHLPEVPSSVLMK